MIVGIDPGLTGAIAFLEVPHRRTPRLVQMPIIARSNGKTNRIDVVRLHPMLNDRLVKAIHVEQVRAMPSIRGKRTMGAQSSFNFGEGFGAVWTVAMLSGVPVHFVEAAKWKRMAGLIGRPKEASLAAALQLYPQAEGALRHGRGFGSKEAAIGRADALLIGHYGNLVQRTLIGDMF